MKKLWAVVVGVGLVLSMLPGIFFFMGLISKQETIRLMLVGLLLWAVGRYFYRMG